MQIPKDRPKLELLSSTFWIDDEGIAFSKPKENAPQDLSREQIASEMQKLRKFLNNKKVCLVSESDPNSRPPKKEDRDYIADEISSIVKALAIITNSPVSRMLANLFFSFKPPQYPVKMFSSEKDAVEWIRQYL
jgi:hypothetical protein